MTRPARQRNYHVRPTRPCPLRPEDVTPGLSIRQAFVRAGYRYTLAGDWVRGEETAAGWTVHTGTVRGDQITLRASPGGKAQVDSSTLVRMAICGQL